MSLAYRQIFIIIYPLSIHVAHGNDELLHGENSVINWCNSLKGSLKVVHGQFCYTMHRERVTWSAAVQKCRAKGGQLFKPDNMALGYVLHQNGADWKHWAGANESDGEFYWLDGSPVVSSIWDSMADMATAVKGWLTNRLLCMTLNFEQNSGSFKFWWEKDTCSDEYSYICEHEIPMNNRCKRLEGWANIVHGQFCYTMHSESVTWSAAVLKCRAKGGQLFKPDNMNLVHALYYNRPDMKQWAGADERGGKFYWVDDTPVVGDFWDGMADLATEIKGWWRTRALCMTLNSKYNPITTQNDYWWEKDTCSDEYPYVCEHNLDAASEVEVQKNSTSTIARPMPVSIGIASAWKKPNKSSKQFIYTGIKRINNVFNPKLIAKPDVLLSGTDIAHCSRICSQDICCELLNHFPPNTCALYCDEKRAKANGADSVIGSKVFIIRPS